MIAEKRKLSFSFLFLAAPTYGLKLGGKFCGLGTAAQ